MSYLRSLRHSPVMQLPRTQRRKVVRRVAAGKAALDPQNASISIAYANWLLPLVRFAKYTFLVLGVLGIVDGATGTSRWWLAQGTGFLLLSVLYLGYERRVRRSIIANEAIAASTPGLLT